MRIDSTAPLASSSYKVVRLMESTVAAWVTVSNRGASVIVKSVPSRVIPEGTTEVIVPASWLSPGAAVNALPNGWQVSADLDGELGYVGLRLDGANAIVMEADGSTTTFTYVNGIGYKPPEGVDDTLATTPGGGLTLHAADGTTYVFNTDGTLASAQAALDDRHPAAAQYGYTGNPARLSTITDPVSGRQITLAYGDGTSTPCGAQGSGFIDPPSGLLCKVSYPDGRVTYLRYESDGNQSGRLMRIEDPGGELTDFAYTNGKLASVRDPLAADMVTALLRANDGTVKTEITYVPNGTYAGRAESVTLPAPTAGALRPGRSYTYGASWLPYTDVHVTGLAEPNGYARRAVYTDDAKRTYSDSDTTGLTTSYTWNETADAVASVTDPAGLRTTTIYDHAGRPTDSYGPAPSAWFDPNTNLPTGGHIAAPAPNADVPHSSTRYDENINNLAATYWNSKNLAGAPVAHGTGIGDPAGGLVRQWGLNPPAPGVNATNWGMRLTGEITLASPGVYQFPVSGDDGVRMWIDDTLVIDSWADGTGWKQWGVYWNTQTTKPHRFRIDYYNNTQYADLGVFWIPPGASSSEPLPGSVLSPRYGLSTSSIDSDGTVSTTEYAQPESGLPTATVQDATGLALRSTTAYEPADTTHYRRPTATALPKGDLNDPAKRTSITYWGATETTPIPAWCGGGTSVAQGGFAHVTTDPAPAQAGTQTSATSIYDAVGRVIASQQSGDGNAWTCTTYDNRDRVTSVKDTAGRTQTFNYATPGIVIASYVDSAGTNRTTRTELDLLGRSTKYVDEQGTETTTTYDQVGRATETWRKLPGGTNTKILAYGFDTYGRPLTTTEYVSTTGGRTTTTTYDPATGRVSSVARPTNTYQLVTATVYNANTGRVDSATTSRNGTTIWTDAYQYTLGGKQTLDWSTGVLRQFTYDTAGRLTRAVDNGSTTRDYAFDTNTNRCANATTCTTPTYIYDNADRITASPYGSGYTYDTHGNLTSYTKTGGGTVTFTYDAYDHATVINDGTTKVEEILTPSGRVLRRVVTSPPGGTVTEDKIFGYAGGGDSPAWSQNTSGGNYTSYLGGVIVTGTTPKYQVANGHGDIVGTTTQGGTFTANPLTDEYGVAASIPSTRLGWLGAPERFTTHTGLGIIRMGVRLYDPHLGRFLQQDPVKGGSCNDYDYVCADPVNDYDLDGRWSLKKWRRALLRWFRAVLRATRAAARQAGQRKPPATPGWTPGVDTPPSRNTVGRPPTGPCHVCSNTKLPNPFAAVIDKLGEMAVRSATQPVGDRVREAVGLGANGVECATWAGQFSQPYPPGGTRWAAMAAGCLYGYLRWNYHGP